MVDPEDLFPFENFPRAPLPTGVSRDKLWAIMRLELEVSSGIREGGIAHKLAGLGEWTDDRLASVAPVVNPGSKIFIQDGFIYGHPPDSRTRIQLFPLESPALQVFNAFNGDNLLVEIADSLAKSTGWGMERSFAYTRGVFLCLVTLGLCQPKMEAA